MPPDCLVARLVVACDTPSTSSAEQSASNRTSSFSSLVSDGAPTDTTSTSHMDRGCHLRRMLCRGGRSPDAQVDAPITWSVLEAELSLRPLERRGRLCDRLFVCAFRTARYSSVIRP